MCLDPLIFWFTNSVEGEDKLEQSLSQDLLDMYDEYYTPEEPTAAFDSNDDSVFIVDDDYESSEGEIFCFNRNKIEMVLFSTLLFYT